MKQLLSLLMMGAADAGSALVIARDTVPQGWSLPGAAVGRKVHMAAAAWSFVLMSLHTGFHAGMPIGIPAGSACGAAAGAQPRPPALSGGCL